MLVEGYFKILVTYVSPSDDSTSPTPTRTLAPR
jgi:hypothetical protein